jgi:hypothetical protein
MSHVFGHHFLLYLEKRKLVRGDATRQQAIRWELPARWAWFFSCLPLRSQYSSCFFMMHLYVTARQLDRFEDYKVELEQQ